MTGSQRLRWVAHRIELQVAELNGTLPDWAPTYLIGQPPLPPPVANEWWKARLRPEVWQELFPEEGSDGR